MSCFWRRGANSIGKGRNIYRQRLITTLRRTKTTLHRVYERINRGALALGILAAVAALSTWFMSSVEKSLRESHAQDDTTPLLYMDNIRATRMNLQGMPKYILAASHMTQYPGLGGVWLEQPSLDMLENQVQSWLIRAGHGWVAPEHALIRLQDAVSIVRPATGGQRPLNITTPELRFCPEPNADWQCPAENYADTDEAVRMETSSGVITGVGLKAYLNKEQVELLSHVRGYYEPAKP